MLLVPDSVLFPDATAVLCSWLSDHLAVPVGARVPNPRPASFVVVKRFGGVRASRVSDRPMLGVECWAENDAAAQDLAQLARAHLYDMGGNTIDGTPVYRTTEVAGPAALPDPDSLQSRYTLTVSVHLRGS